MLSDVVTVSNTQVCVQLQERNPILSFTIFLATKDNFTHKNELRVNLSS